MNSRYHAALPLFLATLLLCLSALAPAASEESVPLTTTDPGIPVEELKLLLKPLTRAELLVEADGWRDLLQETAKEISAVEIEVKRGNQEIAQAEEAGKLSAKAAEKLDTALQESIAPADGDETAAAEAVEEVAEELASSVDELAQSEQAEQAARLARDNSLSIQEKSEGLRKAAAAAAEKQAASEENKVDLLEQVTKLRERRTALADRLETVLDALERKTDEDDGDTLAKIQDYRLYSQAVGGIDVDVQDTTSAMIALRGWALSPEGGQRWALNFAKCLGILLVAWLISGFASKGIRHALHRVPGTSRLLENFLVTSVRWIIMAIGLIMALSALEISIGPMLALLGAAGFVIAFALQDSLSNFASGLMILFFRPFDEGDGIDAGGVAGKVQSMNLVSTTILTFDNKKMIVPNNKIWNDVITNVTGVKERRVDMVFGIGYDDDIDAATEILEDIIGAHPKILAEPAPTIRLSALADSSVNFIVRPWTLTEDYWDVNWDVTRAVKKRFDEAGIGIPFPQRDVHLYLENGEEVKRLVKSSADPSEVQQDDTVRDDGGLDDGKEA